MQQSDVLSRLGIGWDNPGGYSGTWLEGGGAPVPIVNPTTGRILASVTACDASTYGRIVDRAGEIFARWRNTPAPVRGDYIRLLGQALRDRKEYLGALITLETGKIHAEGKGEVQEMIDICDFAVGLSRQLYGLTMASERPRHRMYEQWHPLGPVGVITAFNFPAAVWSWNAAIGTICGDPIVWKPSPRASLTAVAITKICEEVMAGTGLEGVFSLVTGDAAIGSMMADDRRLPLISATGSCKMGREVGAAVARRLGRSLLELGGNNAMIVTEQADLDLATRAALFAAVGTAGQRCTTLRRLIAHSSTVGDLAKSMIGAYESVVVGDPMSDGILMGPLISEKAVESMMSAIETAKSQGGEVLAGGNRIAIRGLSDLFVEPTLIKIDKDAPILDQETFAPILYLIEVGSLGEAIDVNNAVPQGLSSAIFTDSLHQAEQFLSQQGSDCGLANVNIGTSGAEIGGAFGGEKDTGGGRESGSDAWKAYMRRQTTTINWGADLPLAQGIDFG